MMLFGLKNQKVKVICYFKHLDNKVIIKLVAIFDANATSLVFTTLLTDKLKCAVLNKAGAPTSKLVYSIYNLKQLNKKISEFI